MKLDPCSYHSVETTHKHHRLICLLIFFSLCLAVFLRAVYSSTVSQKLFCPFLPHPPPLLSLPSPPSLTAAVRVLNLFPIVVGPTLYHPTTVITRLSPIQSQRYPQHRRDQADFYHQFLNLTIPNFHLQPLFIRILRDLVTNSKSSKTA